ncbi:DUF2975 domain-containing protein [Pseudalkalibacillus berkeleyi]|uniref:DUF2975 domain-containing protein n=1 Tax=Pseudalkalibacillus berkeleyi TaxID=1069813 RepID=A0ABS9H3Q4_9BACL|nr:DUF2975 domain-containing protein [Pseudalkalibacillus berkeleyi]MCF6138440.1 DUF2975 domain-containing protein [Pseudalkalibacillus berkeleyi]
MNRGSTNFLRVVVFLIGIGVLLLCIFALPWFAKQASEVESVIASYIYPVLMGMYVAAIPFFIALYQALRLLKLIDKDHAFSESSVRALRNIKFCAVSISVVYLIVMPFFYLVGEIDDAPGVIMIGLIIIFASMVIAVFAGVLQKLLKSAIDIKSENDLTV